MQQVVTQAITESGAPWFGPLKQIETGLLNVWSNEQPIMAARLTGMGAFSIVTVAWVDWRAHQFRKIGVEEQVKLLALNADVAEQDGRTAIHAYVLLGTGNGTTHGARLIAAHVRPTLELVVDEGPAPLRRRSDPESGLALVALRT
jgi:predicted DNA-binding protein with PD1-like motif